VSGASILSSATRADGFVIVGDDSEGFAAGSEVDVWLYD
jgi:molybdopterin molybdotransferase